ncbi:MAG: hypothetical protein P8Y80_12305, partial [Acidobacteriota bacterium]
YVHGEAGQDGIDVGGKVVSVAEAHMNASRVPIASNVLRKILYCLGLSLQTSAYLNRSKKRNHFNW